MSLAMARLDYFSVLCVFFSWPEWSNAAFTLRHLGTEYLPEQYNPEKYSYDSGAVEQGAIDPNQPILYVIGNNLLHVVDFSNVNLPEVVAHQELGPDADAFDALAIAVCGQMVAVSLRDRKRPLTSQIHVYATYNATKPTMPKLYDIRGGTRPDGLKFTSDCGRFLVADEGNLVELDGSFVDPEPALSVLELSGGMWQARRTDFTSFNARESEYVSRGVRYVYHGENSDLDVTFSQSLEPENIAIDDENKVAYVCLQDNSAIAVLDIETATILDLYGLPVKNWSLSGLDASDKDDGINIRPYPIYGLPQPDAVMFMKIKGKGYLLTANEGNIKDYDKTSKNDGELVWTEAKRGHKFDKKEFADSVPEELLESLEDDKLLGRLKFSKTDGRNKDGEFERLFTFGTRDVGLYRVDDFSQVYSSGALLEEQMALHYPAVFNADAEEKYEEPADTMDDESSKRGCQPSSLAKAELGNVTLVFVGTEKPGMIAVFSLNDEEPEPSLTFESIHYFGGFKKTWKTLYEKREAKALSIEAIVYLPPERSPAGVPTLITMDSIGSSVSFFEVYDDEKSTKNTPQDTSKSSHIGLNVTLIGFLVAVDILLGHK